VESKEALRTWLSIADEVLTRTHRSPGYLEAQRRLLRAGMDFLLAERELVEALVEPAGLPTRSEIDELHKTVQSLKRQVRALEKVRSASRRTLANEPAAPSQTSGSRHNDEGEG
jgi:polyhydroxyalkanoate synthase subunit PhaE